MEDHINTQFFESSTTPEFNALVPEHLVSCEASATLNKKCFGGPHTSVNAAKDNSKISGRTDFSTADTSTTTLEDDINSDNHSDCNANEEEYGGKRKIIKESGPQNVSLILTKEHSLCLSTAESNYKESEDEEGSIGIRTKEPSKKLGKQQRKSASSKSRDKTVHSLTKKKINNMVWLTNLYFILIVPVGINIERDGNGAGKMRSTHKKYSYCIDFNLAGYIRGDKPNLKGNSQGTSKKYVDILSNWQDKLKETGFRPEHSKLWENVKIVFGLNQPRSMDEKRNRDLEDEISSDFKKKLGKNCKVIGFFWEYPWIKKKEQKEGYDHLKQDGKYWSNFEQVKRSLTEKELKNLIAYENRVHSNYNRKLVPYGQILDRIMASEEVKSFEDEIKKKDGVIAYVIGHADVTDFNGILSHYVDLIKKNFTRDPKKSKSLVISSGYNYEGGSQENEQHIHFSSKMDMVARMSIHKEIEGGIYMPEPGLCFVKGKGNETLPRFSTTSERGANESPRFLSGFKKGKVKCIFDTSFPLKLKIRKRDIDLESDRPTDFKKLRISQSHLKELYLPKYLFINNRLYAASELQHLNEKRNKEISKIMKGYFSVFYELLYTSNLNRQTAKEILNKFNKIEYKCDHVGELVRFTGSTVAPKILKAIHRMALNTLLFLIIKEFKIQKEDVFGDNDSVALILEKTYNWIMRKPDAYNNQIKETHDRLEKSTQEAMEKLTGTKFCSVSSIIFDCLLPHKEEFDRVKSNLLKHLDSSKDLKKLAEVLRDKYWDSPTDFFNLNIFLEQRTTNVGAKPIKFIPTIQERKLG